MPGLAGGDPGIAFVYDDWEEAVELARIENKLIFLGFYANKCRACKKLKKETFSDAETAGFFNEHFINAALNGDKKAGGKTARKYAVKGYPTLVFLHPGGKTIHVHEGFIAASDLLSLGKSIVKDTMP